MHSVRRRAARERGAFTGEHAAAAAAGVGRDGSLGLDRCTPEQRRLRALWALGIFNGSSIQAWPGEWAVAGILAYGLTLSPRHDNLVLVTSTPHNALKHLAPWGTEVTVGNGLPGLRLEETLGGSYLLRHLPTGARMVVTDQVSTRPDPLDPNGIHDASFWSPTKPLTDLERGSLADLPPMTADAETLLAAVAVRICLRDPHRGWDLGGWFHDPLQRPREDIGYSTMHRLWGGAGYWELEWQPYPYPADLAAALSHPRVGIPDAKIERVRRGWDIHLGDAVLALRPSRSRL